MGSGWVPVGQGGCQEVRVGASESGWVPVGQGGCQTDNNDVTRPDIPKQAAWDWHVSR